jgi:hypothetical protein
MASKKITPEQAAAHVYAISLTALEVASGAYKSALSVSSYIERKTDNTIGRLSGVAYYAKTIHAVIGGFKDVGKEKLSDILLDGKLNFKEKIKASVKHAHDNFSHQSTVGMAMLLGKEALVIAPIAIGISALVGLMAPAAAMTAGLVAGVGLMQGATYFLATHAGHKLETTMADKIKAGMQFITGFRRAAKGEDKEYAQVNEIAAKMEAAAAAEHRQAPAEPHGDHHHHHKLSATLKQDLIALARVDKYPAELAKYVKDIAKDCMSLFNKTAERSPAVTHEAKAPESRFMQKQHPGESPQPGQAGAEIAQEKKPPPPTKKSQPKPGA